jgi:hypothetical protein
MRRLSRRSTVTTTAETTYLVFEEQTNPGRKTKVWIVRSRRTQDPLGMIQWYGPWRQYCFYPEGDTIFNNGCLRDVERFLTERMAERREK